MLPQEIQDALSLLGMVIFRVGLPAVITFGIGVWAERKFRLSDEMERATQIALDVLAHRPSKIIPLQCWVVTRCDPARASACPAFKRPDLPCWQVTQVKKGKVRDECLSCKLYRPRVKAA